MLGYQISLPSPLRRSDRALRRPAASVRSRSRAASRSRSSFSRWFRAAAPLIFFALPLVTALAAFSSSDCNWTSASFSEGELERVRCRLADLSLLYSFCVSQPSRNGILELPAYSSSSLRLLFPPFIPPSSLAGCPSSFDSSIALRNSSSSSYAASRLFIVDLRFVNKLAFCRDCRGSFFRRGSSLEEALDDREDELSVTGRYLEYFCLYYATPSQFE